MKTTLYGIIHNVLAHPLMGLSGSASWSVRFHDWTASKAWPS